MATASGAVAGDNDIQLWRLGHPDDLLCTKCDGTDDGVIEPGDPGAQARFARFASALGLLFVPALFEPAATTGQSGFEVGFSGKVAFPRLAFSRVAGNKWPTAGTPDGGDPPKALFLPTLTVRKGLGGSFELGIHASMLTGSQVFALGGELRWAVVEGFHPAPDIGVRVFGTRVVGAPGLDLLVGGADLAVSWSIGVAGAMKVQPYAQGGIVMINAASGVLDFRPEAEDVRNPTADDGVFRTVRFLDNRYARGVAGLRLVAGVVVLGVEGSYAQGFNPVQSDALAGGGKPPYQKLQLWSASGRLGLAF